MSEISDNLEVDAAADGTWLKFKASNGFLAGFRIESIADECEGISKSALHQWCQDRQAEVATTCPTCKERIEIGCEPDGCRDPLCPMMEGR